VGDSRLFRHDDEIGSIATEGRQPFDPAPPDLTMSRARSVGAIHKSRGRESDFFKSPESRSDKELVGGGASARLDDVAIVVGSQQAEGLVVGGPGKVFDAIGLEFSDAMTG
jgi:hypothetical protein